MNFFILVLCLMVFVFIAWLIGSLAPVKYHSKVSEKFDATSDTIWNVLAKIDLFPKYRKDVKKVSFIGKNMKNFPIWKEYNRFDVTKELELMERKEKERIVVHIRETWTGMRGQWAYELHEKNGETIVTICEDTLTESVIGRFFQVIRGRDAHSKTMFSTIEHHLEAKRKPQTSESSPNVSS